MAELSAIKPRNRDWLAGLGFAELNWVADLACLAACCHAVGANGSSLLLVMVAYIAGMSTSGLSLLPGGLGVVDAAMIFALTQGGVSTVPRHGWRAALSADQLCARRRARLADLGSDLDGGPSN